MASDAHPQAGKTLLTLSQLDEIARDAQIAFCLDKYSSFEVALARGVEAAVLSAQPAPAAGPELVDQVEAAQKAALVPPDYLAMLWGRTQGDMERFGRAVEAEVWQRATVALVRLLRTAPAAPAQAATQPEAPT